MATDRMKALETSLEEAVAAALPQPDDFAIRAEEPRDSDGIRTLLKAAFETAAEADLVEAMRRRGAIVLSLVATHGSAIVGYVSFARIWVEQEGGDFAAVALAPLAVAKEYRGRGIGALLVKEGHACLAAKGEALSIVLGDPRFYGRLGYSRHRASGFASDYPEEFLLAISFADAPREGALSYPDAFRNV